MLAQFKIATDDQSKYNCAGCSARRESGDCKLKCLKENESVDARATNCPPAIGITKSNWRNIVHQFRKHIGDDNIPEILILKKYGICPIPLIDAFSIEAWNLYNACGGMGRISKPSEYYGLPALFVQAVGIIQNSINLINPYLEAK